MVKTCTPTDFHGTYVITHYTVWYSLVRGSDCFLTTTEPLQSSFSIEPRPPRSGDLWSTVLARIRVWLPCSHMPKRTELRGETCQVPKQRARCESTLILICVPVYCRNLSRWRAAIRRGELWTTDRSLAFHSYLKDAVTDSIICP